MQAQKRGHSHHHDEEKIDGSGGSQWESAEGEKVCDLRKGRARKLVRTPGYNKYVKAGPQREDGRERTAEQVLGDQFSDREKYPVREPTVMPACFGRIAILRNASSRIGFEG
jgi:hypothetical protein